MIRPCPDRPRPNRRLSRTVNSTYGNTSRTLFRESQEDRGNWEDEEDEENRPRPNRPLSRTENSTYGNTSRTLFRESQEDGGNWEDEEDREDRESFEFNHIRSMIDNSRSRQSS
jgi:hypothetical protein